MTEEEVLAFASTSGLAYNDRFCVHCYAEIQKRDIKMGVIIADIRTIIYQGQNQKQNQFNMHSYCTHYICFITNSYIKIGLIPNYG
jgi:hypothetical protein